MSYLVIHLEIFLDHKSESPIFVSYSSPFATFIALTSLQLHIFICRVISLSLK